jgi:hypothetical protein
MIQDRGKSRALVLSYLKEHTEATNKEVSLAVRQLQGRTDKKLIGSSLLASVRRELKLSGVQSEKAKRKGREVLYYKLATFSKEELKSLSSIDVLHKLVDRLNETGRTNLELVELMIPEEIEIREKHK